MGSGRSSKKRSEGEETKLILYRGGERRVYNPKRTYTRVG